MAGTKLGAQKARATIISRHGADFYKRIGAIGGQNGHTGGFFADRELARRAGRIGGMRSKRGPSKKYKKGKEENDGETKSYSTEERVE